jgi:[acyl-carrier-protein] S-malonyltransferase
MVLPVGGAFHSPLMEPAQEELSAAIEETRFNDPLCPIYQNVSARAVTDPAEIKRNLMMQLTSPVRWTQTIQHMIADGATEFTEIGPGKVLQGLVRKIDRSVSTNGVQ